MGLQEGDRHYGEYINLLGQNDARLRRSIRSYRAEIDEHKAKLSNPMAYYVDWYSKDVREQAGALRYWAKEIRSLKEKLALAENIADERGLWHG